MRVVRSLGAAAPDVRHARGAVGSCWRLGARPAAMIAVLISKWLLDLAGMPRGEGWLASSPGSGTSTGLFVDIVCVVWFDIELNVGKEDQCDAKGAIIL